MSFIFSLICIALLVVIAYQDFKLRAVTWFLFPLLALVMILENILNDTFLISLDPFLFNISFVALQLSVITLYFSIRNRRFVKIWDAHIGPGDILFLVVLCLFFSPVNFVLFYVGSLLFVITMVLVAGKFTVSLKLIPLAGIQSALLAVLVGVDLFWNSINYKVDVDINTLF